MPVCPTSALCCQDKTLTETEETAARPLHPAETKENWMYWKITSSYNFNTDCKKHDSFITYFYAMNRHKHTHLITAQSL